MEIGTLLYCMYVLYAVYGDIQVLCMGTILYARIGANAWDRDESNNS